MRTFIRINTSQNNKDKIQELIYCKNDIIYFIEKYCKLMTPEGIKHIKLRNYQKNYLNQLKKYYENNRIDC